METIVILLIFIGRGLTSVQIWETYLQQKQEFQLVGYLLPEERQMLNLQQDEEMKVQQYVELLQLKSRNKRGALNVMGSIVKAIIGNLVDKDGRRYDNQIQKLQNNQQTIQKL